MPGVETVTPEVGELGTLKVAVPGPLTWLQAPEPTIGALPAIVPLVPQNVLAGPALAVVGFGLKLTTMSLVEAGQDGAVIVQRSV